MAVIGNLGGGHDVSPRTGSPHRPCCTRQVNIACFLPNQRAQSHTDSPGNIRSFTYHQTNYRARGVPSRTVPAETPRTLHHLVNINDPSYPSRFDNITTLPLTERRRLREAALKIVSSIDQAGVKPRGFDHSTARTKAGGKQCTAM